MIRLLLSCLCFGLGLPAAVIEAQPARSAPVKLTISGDAPANGLFDPSIEFAPGASEGWLAYSAVFGSSPGWGPHVETRLARTTDAGTSWSFHSVVNPSTPDVLQLSDGSLVDGVWNYEVSSLVHDPEDPGAEWKLFAHRLFRLLGDPTVEDQNLPAYGWITLRSAPDPTGPWSDEEALFGSDLFPPPPYDDVRISVNQLDPSLAPLIVYSGARRLRRGRNALHQPHGTARIRAGQDLAAGFGRSWGELAIRRHVAHAGRRCRARIPRLRWLRDRRRE